MAQPPPLPPTAAMPQKALKPGGSGRPGRRGCAAGLLLLVALVVGAFWLVGAEVDKITTTIDDIMISDRQQEIIDEIPTVASCATLRTYVAFSQEIIAGEGATDEGFFGTPYAERLGEAAEAQLDKLRCGG